MNTFIILLLKILYNWIVILFGFGIFQFYVLRISNLYFLCIRIFLICLLLFMTDLHLSQGARGHKNNVCLFCPVVPTEIVTNRLEKYIHRKSPYSPLLNKTKSSQKGATIYVKTCKAVLSKLFQVHYIYI